MSGALVMDPAFGHWFSGFCDGEACFTICTLRSRGYTSFQCRLEIRLRADDRAVLELIHSRLGGALRDTAPYKTTNAAVSWRVDTKTGCRAICDVLDRYPLRSKKARDYVLWRRAVEQWEKHGRHRGRNDWTVMAWLKANLEDQRRYAA